MSRLPAEDQNDPEQHRIHRNFLDSASNGILVADNMHLNFSEYYLGYDVGVSLS